jgi:phosphoribosyl 1,2-cyclic phosphodiesterase
MLQVAALGSGSSGNSLLVRSGGTTLLVDCGFTMKETIARMHHLGVTPSDLSAVLVSHEHGDHVKGVGPLSRKFGLPVWCTHGTYNGARDNRFSSVRLFNAHEPFVIDGITVDPFPTPHDAAESCQFVFSVNAARFANVTDLGACTPHVKTMLTGVNGLVVECNYDNDMLRNGPYPPSLQARIRSDYGHLGNDQAGMLLKELDHPALQHILLGHLSEQNNSDAAALATMHSHLDDGHERVFVLAQHCCSHWFDVHSDNQNEPTNSAVRTNESTLTPIASDIAVAEA